MYCPDCGKKILFYSKFCPNCGSVLRSEDKNVTEEPKWENFEELIPESEEAETEGETGIPPSWPTIEGGYRCEYKIDSPNYGKNVPCWDYLTYSGGRYLGGNSGCPEYGLLPK